MDHPHARQLLGFYRSCYLADSRDLDLDNLSKLPANRWAWLDAVSYTHLKPSVPVRKPRR